MSTARRAVRHGIATAAEALGGPLATYFCRYLDGHDAERVQSSLRSLARRMKRIEGRQSAGIFENDEFAELVLKMMRIAEDTLIESRHEAAAHIVSCSTLEHSDDDYIAAGKAQFLLCAIRDLSHEALALLVRAANQASSRHAKLSKGESVNIDFRGLKGASPGTDEDYIMALVSELDRFNLLHKMGPPGVAMGGKYDNYNLRITPFAIELINLLKSASEEES